MSRQSQGPKARYGFLGLRRYDPTRERLVKASRYVVDLPWGSSNEEALRALDDAVPMEERDGFWAQGPKVSEWHCGCTGDALSGLMPCDFHMDEPGAPGELVVAEGVWLPAPRECVPLARLVDVKAGRECPVLLSPSERPLPAAGKLSRPSGLAG